MSKRQVPMGRLLSDRKSDNNPLTVTLTVAQFSFVLGQCRASYRYVMKQRASYLRQHGKAFEPQPGKSDIHEIAIVKLEAVERALSVALGVVSMFDGGGE